MTPEQTLDWLAEQHRSQCDEDRPIQEWIRGMKSMLPAPVQEPDDDLTQALIERDEYHSIADQLAEVIAQITGADIGEHTSSNFPWHNALDAAKEWIATPPAAPVQEPVGEVQEYRQRQFDDDGCVIGSYSKKTVTSGVYKLPHGTKLYTTPPAAQPEPMKGKS